MQDVAHEVLKFIDLNYINVLYLFAVGFVGGLVSGFIGSGGAFVLTPGMMSLGVPGLVAVASNMCHKFPKALVGAIKRAKYGQVDVKLGIIFGIFAEAGVFYGATIQENIKRAYGDAGSNLYVSASICCHTCNRWHVRSAGCSENLQIRQHRSRREGIKDSQMGAIRPYTRNHGIFQEP